jgi:oligopeptide transport system substrate-binding protein
MTRRPALVVFVCLLAGLPMALAACGPATSSDYTPIAERIGTSTPPTSLPGEPVEITLDLGAPPSTLDPARVALLDVAGRDLVENLFVGLTYFNPDTGQIEPALAKGWELSSDGLTWTFHLRDDIFWVRVEPNGGEVQTLRPVVAADLVHALARACRADLNAPDAQTLFVVRGCREIYTQDPASLTSEFIAATLGVRALDETTVEYRLERGGVHFLSMTSMPIMRPVPVELAPEPGSAWTDPSVIWASGAWLVAGGDLSDRLTLIANPTWPLERAGNVTRVEVTFDGSPGADFGPASDGDEAQLLAQPVVAFLTFSFEQPPAHDEHVRRALAASLDRERLIAEALGPDQHALPLTGIIPPGTAFAPDGQIASGYDAEYAQAELAEAGYPDCRGLPPITLMVDSSDTSQRVGESLAAMWEETLGCRAGTFTVDTQPYQDVGAAAQNVPPPTPTPAPPEEQPDRPIIRAPIILRYWQADYPDANNWTADILGCAEAFPGAYLHQARDCGPVDQAMQQAVTVYNADTRADLYRRIEEQLFGADGLMPVVPLYVQERAVHAASWLTIWPTRAGPLRFDAWLVDEETRP